MMEGYKSRPERAEQVAIGREHDPCEIFDFGVDPGGSVSIRTVGEILYGDGSGGPPMGILAKPEGDWGSDE